MFSFSFSSQKSALLCALVLSLFVVQSCTESTTPSTPSSSQDSSVIVVNQGAYNSDNASLSRINRATDSVEANWFSEMNFGRKLGATANDVMLKGDTAFVSVTNSHTIEVINAKTGKLLTTILLSSNNQPWKLSLLSPSLAAVSTTNGDGIQFFDPRSCTLKNQVVTGPATQGLCGNSRYAWVANSGYGTLRAGEQHAGTIAVVDLATMQVSYRLTAGKNVTELVMSEDGNRVYAYYQELYTNTTAKQGIIEYDEASKMELRRWEFDGMGFMNYWKGNIYVLGKASTSDVNWSVLQLNTIVASQTLAPVFSLGAGISPNGLSVHPRDGSFWVSDAGDFNSRGKIVVFSNSGTQLKSYSVGLIPGYVAFYH